MKFAHDFKQSLASQGFPPHWVVHAIPYSQLKKCLKRVQRELQDLGLDPETLQALLDPNTDSPVALEYKLSTSSDSNIVRPKLTVYIHLQNGVPVDASLTPSSRRFFERIAADLPPDSSAAPPEPQVEPPNAQRVEANHGAAGSADGQHAVAENGNDRGGCETLEVPLVFDGEFFDMLQSDVNSLDALQSEEQRIMTEEIVELGKEVSQVSRPTRFSKSDLNCWRRIFELYLDADVFFATHERDHGARSSQKALKQLQWFQNEVEKQHLANAFKLAESRLAFARFLKLNVSLLKCLQFQELNRLAVSKILKKFDKRTALGVSQAFPVAINSDRLLSDRIAKDVCAQMSQELVSVVPQINDYLCPVCYSVAYRPIRLDCQHVFCIRCIIKIQRRKEKHCPLCRADVVMDASAENVDHKLEKFMRRYFAEEVKEKQRANEMERGIEDFGPGYTHQQCAIM